MNKAILIGNLTKDPEISTTTSGISVCNFTLAVSRKYANAQGEREADFIIAWRATGSHNILKKVKKIALVGTIQTNYENQEGKFMLPKLRQVIKKKFSRK